MKTKQVIVQQRGEAIHVISFHRTLTPAELLTLTGQDETEIIHSQHIDAKDGSVIANEYIVKL